jgi:alanyl aminopeptidase
MSKTILASLAVAAVCLAAKTPDAPRLRLPDTTVPTRYSVNLTIVPDQDNFEGAVDIDVSVKEPEDLLWLNATNLNIKEAIFKGAGQTYPATVIPGGNNFAGLHFAKPVGGTGTLHIAYSGSISRNSSAGLFQMKDRDNWYVYSQFEPTDARRAFPCFDEPNYKVPWQMTLHVPAEDMALSNTAAVSETPGSGGMKTVTFGVTKPLPSYLIALAVGPFDAVSAGKVGRTPLRIIVPKGRGGEAAFAAQSIPELLKLLEKYFGTAYPYEKLDSVVMPISNFAMENVGLITYGQSLLLSKPDNDTIGRQRTCAIVTAHEMAHQWFGDLVTTAWWNDIWLNEAFATWMENKITGEWKPEWNMAITEVDGRLSAENLDSLASARKIRQPIVSDDDIANAFDDITYEKGAAVIHMFEHWIGSDTFRKGVRLYIKQHANGNATTSDFEAAISAAAGKNIAPAFDSFLDQPGVPLLTTSLDCSTAKHPLLKLTQKRSLPIGSPGSTKASWLLPVCVKYESNGEVYSECELLSDPSSEMPLRHAKSCPTWVLANDQEVGYYRVNYQGDLLKQALADGGAHLTVAERVGVLGDVNALVNSGEVSPKLALSLVPEFSKDPDRHVVESALEIAGLVNSRILPEDLQPKAAAYIRQVFGPRALQLGWQAKPDDDENTKLLRQTLVEDVAQDGQDRPLIDQAGKLARQWLAGDHKSVEPGMLGPVMHIAAEYGDRDLFDRLKDAAIKEKDQRTRETLIGALGSFRDPEIAKSAMGLLLTNDFDVRESFYQLLFGPLSYPETRSLPFEFVKSNLDALLARLPREVGADFAASLPEVGRSFCDAGHRAQVQSFFEDRVKQYTGGPRNLTQTLESIDVCIARKQALAPELSAFLRSQP